jgi:single-strand DNA-binding protein
MATFTVEGTIKEIAEEQVFPSGFSKREFVVTVPDDKYPQDIKFDALKDRAAMLNGFEKGHDVSVTFDLRGREYNGRHFVDLVAWKLERKEGDGSTQEPPPPVDDLSYDESEGDPPF